MRILSIETSCDETAAAIVEDGVHVISQSLATSLDQHVITGGIVPEVAARAQVEYIGPVIQEALATRQSERFDSNSSLPGGARRGSTQLSLHSHSEEESWGGPSDRTRLAALHPDDIDAIAVTQGPGLIGSLLVGVETAKTLAYAWNKPLIPVNHMLGHIYGAWLTYGETMDKNWPKLALLVSGGHTELILMTSHTDFKKVGWTLDDAAGEAFDKVAKLLGLPYPGGPALSKLALEGNPQAIDFPLPMPQKDNFNFSFSGLKTAVLHYFRENPDASDHRRKADIAASFQQTVVNSLISKTKNAAAHFNVEEVILGGGVAASTELRKQLAQSLQPTTYQLKVPDLAFTTDNAAVIASAAFYHQDFANPLTVQADPSLELPTSVENKRPR